VPGGTAGLQNWQARLRKIKRERRLSNKSSFLFRYSNHFWSLKNKGSNGLILIRPTLSGLVF